MPTDMPIDVTMTEDTPPKFTENTLRPDRGGKLGKPLIIDTNFFAVSRLSSNNVHHYDVKFSVELSPKRARQLWKQIESSHEMHGIRAVFDGRSNAYAATQSPSKGPITIKLESKGNQTPLSVKLAHVNTIDLSDLHNFLRKKGPLTPNCSLALQALNIAITHEALINFVNRGPSIFFENKARDITGGVEVWKGLFQALKLGGNTLFVNIDVAASTFLKGGNAAEFVQSYLPPEIRSRLDERTHLKLERLLKSATFTVVYHGNKVTKRYKVDKLSLTGARDVMFDRDGRDISVEKHFYQTYGLKLRFPELPCLGVRRKDGQIAYFPAELCEIEQGQKHIKQLDEKQTATLIKVTCEKPADRLDSIKRGIQTLDFDNNQHLRDFGFHIDLQASSVPARVLPAPEVCFDKNRTVRPDNGAWKSGTGTQAYSGAELSHWGILCFEPERQFNHQHMNKFIQELISSLHGNGITVTRHTPPYRYVNPLACPATAIDSFWASIGRETKGDPQLIIIILTHRGANYPNIKAHCENGTTIGKMTQCVLGDRVRTAQKLYYTLLATKVNAKLGGTNWALKPQAMPFLSEAPTMVIGADVTHPPAGESSQPSIVAVVASINREATRYIGRLKTQAGRTEIIEGFKYIVYNLLNTFKAKTRHLPSRILMYRDGVSDGEVAHVLREEMIAIKAACLHIDSKYNPPVTLVVVRKRHHARFFPKDPRDGDRASGNCPPGTVVDSVITHPSEFDFYLQSHGGMQGTARPTLYHVVWDENKFTSDAIQQLTYNMCFLYARCPRAVSIVPPVYYAHLLAFRARHYLGFSDTSSNSSGSDARVDSPLPDIQLQRNVKNKMFFI